MAEREEKRKVEKDFLIRSSGGARGERAEKMYKDYLHSKGAKEKGKGGNQAHSQEFRGGHGERLLERIAQICRETLDYNDGRGVSAQGREDSAVRRDAKYARGKAWIGGDQEVEKVRGMLVSGLGGLEERNEKIVGVIKEVNRLLGVYIEGEAKGVVITKKEDKGAQGRAKVMEKEVDNNRAIVDNVRKELEMLRNIEQRVSKEGYSQGLEEEVRALKAAITDIKSSLVSDVIDTKQNGRKLEWMRKNKNVSREAAGMVDSKKRAEGMENKLIEMRAEGERLNKQLQEQVEKKEFLHTKVAKWKDRFEMYEKPAKDMERVRELKKMILETNALIEKEKVTVIINLGQA